MKENLLFKNSIKKETDINICKGVASDLDKELKKFIFHGNNGQEFEIFTKHVGSIDEITDNLREISKNDKDYKGLKLIIEAFKNYRLLLKNSKGEEIKKAPHLLISGGFVRDILTNKFPNDIDLVTNISLDETFNLIKNLSEVKDISIHGESSKVVRIKFRNGEEYEVSTFKSEEKEDEIINPGQDAVIRDFTINALFYNTFSGNIIDYVGGIKDIKEKKLRFNGSAEKRINEDRIRMLRYIRFLFKTGFDSEQKDEEVIKKMAPEIKKEAPERVKTELDKILQIIKIDEFIKVLDKLNLLEQIFPEINNLKKIKQTHNQEKNILDHTLFLGEKLSNKTSLRLKWATIFSGLVELTKGETKEENEIQKNYSEYEQIRLKEIDSILKRINFSNKEIDDIKWLLANYTKLFQDVLNGKNNEETNQSIDFSKAIFKKIIMNKGIEIVEELVQLTSADYLGKNSGKYDLEENQEKFLQIFNEAKEELEENKKKGIDFKKIVNGKIIMETIDIKPGPEIGIIIKQVLDLLLESNKKFDNEEMVKKYVKELIFELKKT